AIAELWDPDISRFARERIYRRTKGWAAGFNLMLEQVSDSGLDAEVPEAVSDSMADTVIFDYLAGEVFQKFDGATRSLLLECAYLPKLTASMATELTGEHRAAEILSELHRGLGLVSVRAGEAEPLYQHHPLLQDFLKARAGEVFSPDERRRLRRRSAALLEASGSIDDALSLLREEEDWDELVRLTLEHAQATLRQGRAETLEQMLEALPEVTAGRDPWYYYWRAACRFDSAPRESRLFYEKAFTGFMAQPDPDKYALLLACSGAMDAILYELDDLSLLDEWVRVAERLMPKNVELPWPSAQARVAVSVYIALAFRQPAHPDMRYWGEQAFGRLQHIEETNARVTSQLLVAMTFNYIGKFARSREVMSSMRETCRLPQVSALAHKVLKDVEAMYYLFLADHERCLAAMEDGLEVGRASGVRLWTYHLLSSGAAGALGAGDVDTARQLLDRMREHQDSARRLDLVTYHHYAGWLHMLCDDPLAARQSIKTSLHLAIECGCPFYEVYCRLALSHVESALGEHASARAQLRAAEQLGGGIDNRLLHFQWHLVRAEVAFASQQDAEGLRSLREAFAIGREHNYTHTVWWRSQTMADLCVRALEHGIEPAYVQRLVRERVLVPHAPPLQVTGWPWPLKIHAFGKFRVEREDELLGESAKAQRKPMDLLKALVGFGAFDVEETQLAVSLWPRIGAEYAQKSLSTTLHRLRKIIGLENIIVLKQGRLSINRRLCWVDLTAFAQLADEIDATCGSDGDEQDVCALAERLFELYRGPFMAGEDRNGRYAAVREHQRSRFVRCVGGIARFWERRGDTERALDGYRRGLDADALAEGNYRQLMLCLRKLERQAEAVEVYERCRKTIKAELGVEPSPETRAVFEKVISEL
ncbi:MAG: BTAD domain-containing putative transcriptional regulator, partial [Gammaproteobacteria bacterium]